MQSPSPDRGAVAIDRHVKVHQSPSDLNVVVTRENIGANAGSGVAQTGTYAPAFDLTAGNQYRLDSNGGPGTHPFAVETEADGEYLLPQESDRTGSFQNDGEVQYEEDDEVITFTYTQTLADSVAAYQCTLPPL